MAFTRLNINGHMDNNRKTAFEMAVLALKEPEIIYCEDCKNCETQNGKKLCFAFENLYVLKVKSNHYCSYAEREDEK